MKTAVRSATDNNRFDDFFAEDAYLLLKEHLYNYQARKRLIQARLKNRSAGGLILEVGSGVSPVCAGIPGVVYSELSFRAMRDLRRRHGQGHFVVADAMALPFKEGVFADVVCSEVLEHLPDDAAAITELARVCTDRGHLLLTVPHRRVYWALDDRFVEHFRRYEAGSIKRLLHRAGFRVEQLQKVLGPLEKATMIVAVSLYAAVSKKPDANMVTSPQAARAGTMVRNIRLAISAFRWINRFWLFMVRLEARLLPTSMATVLLAEATREAR